MSTKKKKIAAIFSAINLYLQEEKKVEFYKPVSQKSGLKESPWVKYGRFLAMSIRNQCQSKLFK